MRFWILAVAPAVSLVIFSAALVLFTRVPTESFLPPGGAPGAGSEPLRNL